MVSTEDDTRPAVMRHVRAFALFYGSVVWLYALFVLFSSDEMLSRFGATFMLVFSLPVLALVFLPRRPFLGQLILLVGALVMGFSGVGLPMAIYIGAALTDEHFRAWFSGEPLEPDASRGSTLGVAISAVYGLLVGAFHTSGLVFFVTTVVPSAGENRPPEAPNDEVATIKALLDAPNDSPGMVMVKEAHTGSPSFDTAPIPTRVMAGKSIDGDAWKLTSSELPTGVFVWATWCPDCDRQLADLPGPSQMNVVLAATDCETDGVDNRRAVRAKVARHRVPTHARVVCMDADDFPTDIRWYPSAFIADAKGKLRVYYEGGLSSRKSAEIAQALAD